MQLGEEGTLKIWQGAGLWLRCGGVRASFPAAVAAALGQLSHLAEVLGQGEVLCRR